MSYGICSLSTVPIRNSSSHKSEMISQLLFGEVFEILETKGRQWLRVRCDWDNFVGWVAANQTQVITPGEFEQCREHYAYSLEVLQAVMADDHYVPVTLGAQLPLFDGMRLRLGGIFYTFSGQAVFPSDVKSTVDFLLKIARRYLNVPFLWGGRSPFGIDGPGLVQMVFKICGYALPREPAQQVFLGRSVDFVEQALPGDVAFFENRHGRIAHAGILLPGGEILHAYGRVRIDKLDHYGIYDQEQKRYTHRLRVVKRLLTDQPLEKSVEEQINSSQSQQIELF